MAFFFLPVPHIGVIIIGFLLSFASGQSKIRSVDRSGWSEFRPEVVCFGFVECDFFRLCNFFGENLIFQFLKHRNTNGNCRSCAYTYKMSVAIFFGY